MYTTEQYKRLLKCATRMSRAIMDIKLYPLDCGLLNELYESQKEYNNEQTRIVNEDYQIEKENKS